jgi:hypothetical protein
MISLSTVILGFLYIPTIIDSQIKPLLIFILNLIGLKIYIAKSFHVETIKKNVLYASKWTVDGTPCGIVFGKWFIGHLDTMGYDDENKTIFISTKKWVNQIFSTKKTNNAEIDKKEAIFYEKNISFNNPFYISLRIPEISKTIKPTTCQESCINEIIEKFIFMDRKNITIFLYGETGSGKTILTYLLANKLLENKEISKIYYTNGFNPTDYGDSFINLYNKISPTKSSPLIIVLEEIDQILNVVHESKLKKRSQNMPMVYDKTGWSKFLDSFDHGFYPNVILIMTSNKSIDKINNMDPSYLRPGRIWKSFKLSID